MALSNLLSLVTVALAASAVEAAFTPTKMLSAPRRGEAVPNPSGKIAVFSVSKYSYDTHKRTSSWETLDLTTGKTAALAPASGVGEIAWIDDSRILYTNGTELWISTVEDFTNAGYKAATLPAEGSNLKATLTPSGNVNFVVSAMAEPNGGPIYIEPETAPLSSARIYDDIWVRHWDVYVPKERSAIFSGSLTTSGDQFTGTGELKNLLAGTKNLESPYPPFGATDYFDLSPDGSTVAFVSKAPELPVANKTAAYVYVVPHDGSSVAAAINSPTSKGVPKQARGASISPVFSPDSKTLAYLQMDEDNYESDRNIVYTTVLGSGVINTLTRKWDRSPASLKYSPDGKLLVLQTEEYGREKLFTLSSTASGRETPKAITSEGYVAAYSFAGPNQILATNSSIVSSSGYYLVPLSGGASKPLLEPYKIDAELAGLADDQVDEFWYAGAQQKIHGWIVKPIGFDPKKKYPLAFLIHGGPQGSWANSWSTRWNPAVFANQGYVAVAINPTGSTGYGEKLTDDIQGQWGGLPYKDLVLGFEYVAKQYKYIDTNNAIAAGASFGGYMVNWIQGNPFGRKFKALVCHDGVFSTLDQYASEELFFMEHEYKGTIWGNRKEYERWDPAKAELLKQWATPELVIHNDLDYRLPVSEGIAMFNVLQERGVPSKFLNFPDENHWVIKPENALVWQREVLGWINKWTGVNGGVANL